MVIYKGEYTQQYIQSSGIGECQGLDTEQVAHIIERTNLLTKSCHLMFSKCSIMDKRLTIPVLLLAKLHLNIKNIGTNKFVKFLRIVF